MTFPLTFQGYTMTQLNTSHICRLFGVSTMTVWQWRQGTKMRAPLPVAATKKNQTKPEIRFNARSVLAWAKKHQLDLAESVDSVLESAPVRKSGPKPRKPG
jgi:hypothetical protein